MLSSSGSADGAWQSGTLSFIGPPVQVSVASNQKVLVEGHAALGSTAGAGGLLLNICYQPQSGGALVTDSGVGSSALTSPDTTANQRLSYSLGAVLSPAPGNYNVGLCGQANASWNSNGNAYNLAQVATTQ
jgi:hypothetical protein